MHALTQVYIIIRMDDAFALNCRPTVPVGCEEQVVDAKCTRPFLPLVKGLAPRLRTHSDCECVCQCVYEITIASRASAPALPGKRPCMELILCQKSGILIFNMKYNVIRQYQL